MFTKIQRTNVFVFKKCKFRAPHFSLYHVSGIISLTWKSLKSEEKKKFFELRCESWKERYTRVVNPKERILEFFSKKYFKQVHDVGKKSKRINALLLGLIVILLSNFLSEGGPGGLFYALPGWKTFLCFSDEEKSFSQIIFFFFLKCFSRST